MKHVSFDVLDMSFFGNLLLAIFIGNYYSVTLKVLLCSG